MEPTQNHPHIHPIALKLDRSNYNFWKIQILATARAYGFEDILIQASHPLQFLPSSSDSTSALVNPDYLLWLKRDQFMFSWLLSSISPPMLSYIGRCTTSAQIWKAFELLFHSQSKARAMQLRSLLQSTKKGDSSIDDYILKFREISDQLFNIGHEISESNLVSYILQGLGAEFESICVLLASKCDDLSLNEVQFALQTHELRLQNQAAHFTSSHISPQAHVAYQQSYTNIRGRGRGNPANRGGRGGRFSSGNKVVCQLCGKNNHTAIKCYKRFDISFTGPDLVDQTTPPSAHTITTSDHNTSSSTSLPQNPTSLAYTASQNPSHDISASD